MGDENGRAGGAFCEAFLPPFGRPLPPPMGADQGPAWVGGMGPGGAPFHLHFGFFLGAHSREPWGPIKAAPVDGNGHPGGAFFPPFWAFFGRPFPPPAGADQGPLRVTRMGARRAPFIPHFGRLLGAYSPHPWGPIKSAPGDEIERLGSAFFTEFWAAFGRPLPPTAEADQGPTRVGGMGTRGVPFPLHFGRCLGAHSHEPWGPIKAAPIDGNGHPGGAFPPPILGVFWPPIPATRRGQSRPLQVTGMGARGGGGVPCCLGAFWVAHSPQLQGPIKTPSRGRNGRPGGDFPLVFWAPHRRPTYPPFVSTYLSSLLATFPSPCPLASADSACCPVLNKISVNASGQIRYVRWFWHASIGIRAMSATLDTSPLYQLILAHGTPRPLLADPGGHLYLPGMVETLHRMVAEVVAKVQACEAEKVADLIKSRAAIQHQAKNQALEHELALKKVKDKQAAVEQEHKAAQDEVQQLGLWLHHTRTTLQ